MRRPNYRQERMDRARKQAKKAADKLAARAERSKTGIGAEAETSPSAEATETGGDISET